MTSLTFDTLDARPVPLPARTRQIARDISYASSAATRPGRALIRAVENATGRMALIRTAAGYEAEIAAGRDFWEVVAERFRIRLEVTSGSLEAIPRSGPLIVVANHPYGILDGLVMGRILSALRGDFRILAHRIFQRAQDLDRVILPVDFDGTREAMATNLQTRRAALRYLGEGGAVGVFPGGGVATAARPFGRPLDPRWGGFTAAMIRKSDAQVLPIHFDGETSRLFQIASHLHPTLRTALLIREFGRRVNTPVRLAIGTTVPRDALLAHRDPREMMDDLRSRTYALAPKPVGAEEYGFQF